MRDEITYKEFEKMFNEVSGKQITKYKERKYTLRLNKDNDNTFVYCYVSRPNWFHRLMQRLILGFIWGKL
jgi:hypothetical protein